MSEIFRKVLTEDRLPKDSNYYDTDDGYNYCWNEKWFNQDGPLTFTPDWWMEPINLPTDEEIEKIILSKYPGEHPEEYEDLLASIFGGFKMALKYMEDKS